MAILGPSAHPDEIEMMRPRFLMWSLLVAAVIVALIVYFRPRVTVAPSNDSIQKANPGLSFSNSASQAASNSLPGKTTAAHSGITGDVKQEVTTALAKDLESQNASVEFYGRFIDQDSNALPGVKVKVAIEQLTMLAGVEPDIGANTKHIDRTSDGGGQFDIFGEKGHSVTIESVEKDGYEVEPTMTRNFGPSAGTSDSPVLFKMWSTNIHEQLITGNKSFEVVPDGRHYFISLTDGTISENAGGDLTVWIQYTNQVVSGRLYDWSAGIVAIHGGLLEAQQGAVNSGFLPEPPFAMYSAPTDGYVPSFSLKGQIKGGQDGQIGNRFFYITIKDGKEYGRISINLFAPYGSLHPGLVRISYAINPSGSRILR